MTNFKIERNRPTPSDEQILQKKNFDGVLKGMKNIQGAKKWYQSAKLWTGVLATIAITTIISFLVANPEDDTKQNNSAAASQSEENAIDQKVEQRLNETYSFKIKDGLLVTTQQGTIISIPENIAESDSPNAELTLNEKENEIEIKLISNEKALLLNKDIAIVYSNSSNQKLELYQKQNNQWVWTDQYGANFDLNILAQQLNHNTPSLRPDDEAKIKFGKANGATFEIDVTNFPEFSDYRGVKFEVSSEEEGFIEDYYFIDWEKFQLKLKNDQYYLTLYGGKALTFNVNPVLNSKDYEQYITTQKRKVNQQKNIVVSTKKFEALDLQFEFDRQTKKFEIKQIKGKAETLEIQPEIKALFSISSIGAYKFENAEAL